MCKHVFMCVFVCVTQMTKLLKLPDKTLVALTLLQLNAVAVAVKVADADADADS